jgi:APA family basic amino acid/polyamine antiporter
VIWLTTLVNAYATRAGAVLNTATAYAKVAALVALVVLGPIIGHSSVAAAPFASAGPATITGLGAALAPVIFSYLGWNASTYVAGEIESPGRNLPRSLFWGLGICTAIYLLVMVTYVYTLGMGKLSLTEDVGFQVGRTLFGPKGGLVVTAILLVSVFGSLNANVLVGPRIAYAMAADGLFPRFVARLSARAQTPWVAVVAQSVAATILVFAFGDDLFRVLDYTTFAIVLATIADTSALYVLRRRAPDKPRPYRAAGYPVVPLLYIVANVGVAIAMLRGRPIECLTSLGVLATGVPVYWIFARRPAR